MALETATYIDGLNASNPAASDAINTADDHIRLIKSTIKATFPNIDGPMTLGQSQIAPLASPGFTGTPTAPTASPGTNTTQLATTAFVQAMRTALLDTIYPVGSIYTNSTNSTNPGTLLGFGTWTAFAAGRVMVGHDASDALFDTAEETGGSKDATVVAHTHTTSASGTYKNGYLAEAGSIGTTPVSANPLTIPENGTYSDYLYVGGNDGGSRWIRFKNSGATATVSTTGTAASSGSSGTNANLQPYITVYMWKRIA